MTLLGGTGQLLPLVVIARKGNKDGFSAGSTGHGAQHHRVIHRRLQPGGSAHAALVTRVRAAAHGARHRWSVPRWGKAPRATPARLGRGGQRAGHQVPPGTAVGERGGADIERGRLRRLGPRAAAPMGRRGGARGRPVHRRDRGCGPRVDGRLGSCPSAATRKGRRSAGRLCGCNLRHHRHAGCRREHEPGRDRALRRGAGPGRRVREGVAVPAGRRVRGSEPPAQPWERRFHSPGQLDLRDQVHRPLLRLLCPLAPPCGQACPHRGGIRDRDGTRAKLCEGGIEGGGDPQLRTPPARRQVEPQRLPRRTTGASDDRRRVAGAPRSPGCT